MKNAQDFRENYHNGEFAHLLVDLVRVSPQRAWAMTSTTRLKASLLSWTIATITFVEASQNVIGSFTNNQSITTDSIDQHHLLQLISNPTSNREAESSSTKSWQAIESETKHAISSSDLKTRIIYTFTSNTIHNGHFESIQSICSEKDSEGIGQGSKTRDEKRSSGESIFRLLYVQRFCILGDCISVIVLEFDSVTICLCWESYFLCLALTQCFVFLNDDNFWFNLTMICNPQ